MPNNIWPTNFSSGRLSPSHSSEQNFVSCAFRRERSLLSCIRGRLLWWSEFLEKPFYHGFRPRPLHQQPKLLKPLALSQSPLKIWGNSWRLSRGLPRARLLNVRYFGGFNVL